MQAKYYLTWFQRPKQGCPVGPMPPSKQTPWKLKPQTLLSPEPYTHLGLQDVTHNETARCLHIYIYIYMCGCQNYGPFLGTLNIRCRIIIGIEKATIVLGNPHISIYMVPPPHCKIHICSIPSSICQNRETKHFTQFIFEKLKGCWGQS